MRLHLERLPRTVQIVTENGIQVKLIDQTKLPGEVAYIYTSDWRRVVDAIKSLEVRGAPAIGIAGAGAVALAAADEADGSLAAEGFEEAVDTIAQARPTAVNLSWAVERALSEKAFAEAEGCDAWQVAARLAAFAQELERRDEASNRAIGAYGAALLPARARILTHCNAGSLATGFFGTALGVVYVAAEYGKIERVYADETRPVGQGARLTSWELACAGVPVTLICDNMAASLMAEGKVDAVIVGADRIAANGDTANKIGTYGVAVLAKHHSIPFYVAAPTSTIDVSLSTGTQIPIEQRDPAEVLPEPIEGVEVWNPAFDVTPAFLISAIITEKGVFSPNEIAGALEDVR